MRIEAAQNLDVASRPANISIQTLAAKCGLKTEKAVCQHLRKLEAEKLITVSPNPQNQNKHVYTLHLEPMLEWESAAVVATRQKKVRLEARRLKERAAHAIKKAKQSQTCTGGVEASSDSGRNGNEANGTGGELEHGLIEV